LPSCALPPPSSAAVVSLPAPFLRQQWRARAKSFPWMLGPIPR
jgi:hypothetical protein